MSEAEVHLSRWELVELRKWAVEQAVKAGAEPDMVTAIATRIVRYALSAANQDEGTAA